MSRTVPVEWYICWKPISYGEILIMIVIGGVPAPFDGVSSHMTFFGLFSSMEEYQKHSSEPNKVSFQHVFSSRTLARKQGI